MVLTEEEVRKVAELARLDLSDAEIEEYRGQLSDVLAYVAQLNELALDDVEATAHAVAQSNVWREDGSQPSLPVEEVLFNAPAQAEHQFHIQAMFGDE